MILFALIQQIYITNDFFSITSKREQLYDKYEKLNLELLTKQQQLQFDLNNALKNSVIIESIARYNLDLVEDGEIYYKFK